MTLRSFNLINVCSLHFNISFVVVWMSLSPQGLPHLFRSLLVICAISVCFCNNNNRKLEFLYRIGDDSPKFLWKLLNWTDGCPSLNHQYKYQNFNIGKLSGSISYFIVLWFTYCLFFCCDFFFQFGMAVELRVPCQKANHQLSWTTFMAN